MINLDSVERKFSELNQTSELEVKKMRELKVKEEREVVYGYVYDRAIVAVDEASGVVMVSFDYEAYCNKSDTKVPQFEMMREPQDIGNLRYVEMLNMMNPKLTDFRLQLEKIIGQ